MINVLLVFDGGFVDDEYEQEGHSGPESLTSLYYVHQSYKLMRP